LAKVVVSGGLHHGPLDHHALERFMMLFSSKS
jgi:hypothetical protein